MILFDITCKKIEKKNTSIRYHVVIDLQKLRLKYSIKYMNISEKVVFNASRSINIQHRCSLYTKTPSEYY